MRCLLVSKGLNEIIELEFQRHEPFARISETLSVPEQVVPVIRVKSVPFVACEIKPEVAFRSPVIVPKTVLPETLRFVEVALVVVPFTT